MNLFAIRQAVTTDFDQIWPMLRETFSLGETYAFSPEISKQEACNLWMELPRLTFVVEVNNQIVATYFLKANQPALGSHVANAGFVTDLRFRGQGIGQIMCEHALNQARTLGFKAMQFNFVVSSNTVALRLWEKCGFEIVGRLPKAFKHHSLGYIDAFVLYQWLE